VYVNLRFGNRRNSGRPRANLTDNNVNIIRVPYLVNIEACAINLLITDKHSIIMLSVSTVISFNTQ